MKKIAYLLVLSLLITSCVSTKKQLQKGNYDVAIERSVKKLMRKPDATDEILILDKAYNIANEQDLNRIKYLKLESNPDRWDEILNHYLRLKNRQARVRTVLPLRMPRRTIDYEYFDYDREIVEAKHNAAEFFFAHGRKLMGNDNKESYREAYYEFSKVKEYRGDYENIDQLINESHYRGMSRVLVTIENKTHLKLSEGFKQDLLAINHASLNSEWVEYHTRHLDDNINYDYLVYISLKIIDVSPESVKEKDFIERKKVEDGFDYALDQNGNVMRDTAGNDIKITKYKTLQCTVIETVQQKAVNITGDVEIIRTNPEKLIKKDAIGAETYFEHLSARAIGDPEALSTDTRKLVEIAPVPFPDDVSMIMQCSETLKLAIRDILRRNRRYIY